MKTCEICNGEVIRIIRTSGKLEPKAAFHKKRTCGLKCSAELQQQTREANRRKRAIESKNMPNFIAMYDSFLAASVIAC